MGLARHNAVHVEGLRVRAVGPDRRRHPRYEALGPGELRTSAGVTLGSMRLIDESNGGMACATGAPVEVGQVVSVRVGGATESWRPAIVISSLDCGSIKRLGLMYQQPLASLKAA